LEAFGQPLHDFPAITASVCNLRPESRGTVEITSPDPSAATKDSPQLPLHRKGTARRPSPPFAKRAASWHTAPMSKYVPKEMKPGQSAQDETELAQAAGDIGTTIFHPVGTVRMGSDPNTPLDAELRLRGIGGLRVVDASIMPKITSGNTNSPCIMIGEKAAEMMLATD